MSDQPTHETSITRVWYLETGGDNGGRAHVQRVEYRPGSPFPPSHLHPRQNEHFEIERGSMEFAVDGASRIVGQGDTIDIPAGSPHRARNASHTAAAVVRWETTPALRTTEFFDTAARLGDRAGLLRSALLAHEFRDVFELTDPTRFLVPGLAGLARILGRRLPSA